MQPAVSPQLPEPEAWASSFGQRLRYLQANLADEAPENRQAYLEEELKRALQPVPSSRRAVYLDALAQRFPTWDMATVTVDSTANVTPQTPDEIIAAFLQLAPKLSAEQRDAIKGKLAALGMIVISNKPIEGEALVDLQSKLKLAPDDPIDPNRLGKLFAVLADTLATIDQLAWNVWKNAAPKSAIRRDSSMGDLRLQLRRSLTGDAENSATQIQQQLERTRQIVAGLLAGLGSAGRNFARRHLQRYSPDAIREAVKLEGGGGMFANVETKCWKKYTEVATEITEASIETDVQEAVAKYAEDLIRGSTR
jgi:hypothetical protein